MTDQSAPVSAGGDAQPIADARIVDSGLLGAGNEQVPESAKPEGDPAEGKPEGEGEPTKLTPEQEVEKLRRAKSRDDRKIGKLTAIRYQTAQELQAARDEIARLQGNPATKNTGTPQRQDGEPNEADYTTYHEYNRALIKWEAKQEAKQEIEALKREQTENQKVTHEQHWESQRLVAVDKEAEVFAKDHPEVVQLFNENAALIKSFPPEIKRALLEADNTPLAFYNLAKEDKLEDLADMSLVDAKVEIRLAQMKAAVKPLSKAPAPLPASRGSVAAEKDPADMTDAEWNKWRRAQLRKNNNY